MTKRIIHPVKLLRAGSAGFNGVKYSLSAMLLSMILVLIPVAADFSSISQARATNWLEKAQTGGLERVGQAYGGGAPQDIRMTVVNIIKIILGFLGILTVVLIIWAGFKWLLSRGNEEEVATAKKILTAGIIGLVIILSAYIIANFVISYIYGAATGQPVLFP